ncbi:MAG TPA: TonB-dependent receptor, partial [Chitinophagaceae bacterium]|nr:TonB-dependent receptor [Chitinophagaceae bacterium]
MTYQTSSTETLNGTSKKFANDSQEFNNLGATDQTTFALGSGYTQYSLVSYLGRINYAWRGKYLLTLSGRIDGSSRFAVNNKYATFPAAAIAWRASDETFIKNLNIFSNLKIRASYGVVGNQAIPPYASLPTLNAARYILNNINALGYVQGNYGNPSLKWEKTAQYDLGIEMSFLANRITLETDLYSKTTHDLLLSQQLPVQTGFTSISTNIGSVKNQGVEFLLNTVNIDHKNFRWNSSFNISLNRNKVLDLGGVPEILTQNITYAGNVSRLELGMPVGLFWGAQYYGTRKNLDKIDGVVGKNPAVPVLGEALYYDRSGDGKLGTDDYTVIGDANPDFYGGMSNTFNYKRFELNFYIAFSKGNQVMNIADNFYNSGDPLSNNYKSMVNRWSPSNPNSDIPTMSRDYVPNTRWIYDGSFLRLKSASIGYNIPGNVMRLSWVRNVNIYVSASN